MGREGRKGQGAALTVTDHAKAGSVRVVAPGHIGKGCGHIRDHPLPGEKGAELIRLLAVFDFWPLGSIGMHTALVEAQAGNAFLGQRIGKLVEKVASRGVLPIAIAIRRTAALNQQHGGGHVQRLVCIRRRPGALQGDAAGRRKGDGLLCGKDRRSGKAQGCHQ